MPYDVVSSDESPWLRDVVQDSRVSVGEHTYFEGPITLGLWEDDHRIQIGRYSWIARDSLIFGGGNHPTHSVSSFDFTKLFGDEGRAPDAGEDEPEPTVIGNDVWIAQGATILPGAVIGDGAMIGAKAVVAGRIPPYALAVGNPARVVRIRFREDTVKKLLKMRWWDWSKEGLRHAMSTFHTNPDEWPDEAFRLKE